MFIENWCASALFIIIYTSKVAMFEEFIDCPVASNLLTGFFLQIVFFKFPSLASRINIFSIANSAFILSLEFGFSTNDAGEFFKCIHRTYCTLIHVQAPYIFMNFKTNPKTEKFSYTVIPFCWFFLSFRTTFVLGTSVSELIPLLLHVVALDSEWSGCFLFDWKKISQIQFAIIYAWALSRSLFGFILIFGSYKVTWVPARGKHRRLSTRLGKHMDDC